MYTECPDCKTAFRVTAPVLQQSAGQVRCGRCGCVFNALERLSEDPPGAADSADRTRMLQTLDELSGPEDIRIEDTGVEWRVIDEEALETDADDAPADPPGTSGSSAIRWYIEDADRESAPSGSTAPIPEITDALRQDDGGREAPSSRPQRPLELGTSGDGEELRYDDNTPLPDGFADEPDLPEPPRRRAEDHIEPRSAEFDELQSDLALGEPGEWMELLDELGPGNAPDVAAEEAPEAKPGSGDTPGVDEDDTDIRALDDDGELAQGPREGFPGDIDTQFDLQALEMGIDLTGNHRLQEDPVQDRTTRSEPATGDDAASGDEPPLVDSSGEDLEPGIAADDRPADEEAEDTVDTGPHPGHDEEQPEAPFSPPPLSDEEMTINMLIDQDLMRYAAEQDVLTSTGSVERRAPHVETIIMEGDDVRNALDGDDEDSAATAASATADKPESAGDPWLPAKESIHGGRRWTDPASWSMLAGIAVLALVLVAQVVHAYRDTLATNDTFASTVGSVYQLLGEPVVPGWDARGWQFESTSGSTDDSGKVLSISSRIANRSGDALPYPLMYVSLTDRWEETVGASVLKPRDYLRAGVDTGTRVPSGGTFAALITIQSLSAEATGFKLNVCYPGRAGQLRCAIEDFRN